MMINNEENDAVLRCQRGEVTGLEVLVKCYQVPALRMAYLLVGDYAIAEDIVQDSFLSAYKGIAQYDLKRPFSPWFYRIVTNTARQHLRSLRRHPALSLEQYTESEYAGQRTMPILEADTSFAYDPVQFAERSITHGAMLRALAELTSKQREAVVLRYYCDCSEREMAEILHCLPGTVKWRLHAGLKALERIIRQQYSWLLEEHDYRSEVVLPPSATMISNAAGIVKMQPGTRLHRN